MRKAKGTLLIVLGLVLIASALGLTLYNMQTELQAGKSAAQVLEQLNAQEGLGQPASGAESALQTADPKQTASGMLPDDENAPMPVWQPDYIRFPEMEMPTAEVEGHTYIGTLRIPELGLELPVMSDWSYPQLKKAPCRFAGSAYLNDLILIAHNYATHFGNLKNLMPGAEVTFTDMAGNVFCYAVAETEILKPRQMEELTGTDYPLTLLTCTLGGETRVTVRCEKIGEIPAGQP
ncbi:MAG: sortase [Clostridiales bacterium]|nr:sortase [Clostridiales bacterium]